ncbi:ABC-three component system middle component 1 (plasmid) [Cetobacterium somerae]|uniref:ABC-three component system middle component 1 n=1 Tax=Cetobacterium somerae TaxID=188913 RepID=UPI002E7B4D30|nr:ABC-three component system middle component 1 [Cetobacterium somerae]WVJ03420.1 ABC-three component system middle component 1 [Cetobacterium somerae]
MDNILKEIFDSYAYLQIRELNKNEWFVENNTKNSFYVVIFLSELNENNLKNIINQKQESLYESLSSKENFNAIVKNTNLLILLQSDKEINKEIMAIEEDEYFFKKYILKYSSKELESLNEYKGTLINKIESIKNDYSGFKKFKQKKELYNNNWFSLLMKLYIKIPELNLSNYKKEIKPINLINDIDKELEDNNLLDLKNLLLDQGEKKRIFRELEVNL